MGGTVARAPMAGSGPFAAVAPELVAGCKDACELRAQGPAGLVERAFALAIGTGAQQPRRQLWVESRARERYPERRDHTVRSQEGEGPPAPARP